MNRAFFGGVPDFADWGVEGGLVSPVAFEFVADVVDEPVCPDPLAPKYSVAAAGLSRVSASIKNAPAAATWSPRDKPSNTA